MTPPLLAALAAAPAAHEAPGLSLPLALAVILAAGRLGGALAERLGQPAVLGELLAGVLVGNLDLVGWAWFRQLPADPAVNGLAGLGVILLLFEVGLESNVEEMRRVGARALLVAVLGVVAPWVLGYGVGALLLPGHSPYVHIFLGATLTATSVGITARVLRDLGRSQTPEARIILGAAVIDDVLGLVILAGVAGLIAAANQGGNLSAAQLGLVLAKATAFLVAALWLGQRVSPRFFGAATRLRGTGVLLTAALVFCFGLAWLASAVDLAPIVGAYAAGLILDRVHYQGFTERGEHHLEELLRPLTQVLAPVFFVVMGMRVELRAFADPSILGLAALLTLAAVVGKQACALGAIGTPLDKLSIGLGMIPRGEVGLIFANLGLTLTVGGERVVDPQVYATVVIMVMVTTVVTPPLLGWSLRRPRRPG